MSLDQRGAENDPLTFTLIDKTPGSDLRIVIQAPIRGRQAKLGHADQVQSLDMQGDFLKGMCSTHRVPTWTGKPENTWKNVRSFSSQGTSQGNV